MTSAGKEQQPSRAGHPLHARAPLLRIHPRTLLARNRLGARLRGPVFVVGQTSVQERARHSAAFHYWTLIANRGQSSPWSSFALLAGDTLAYSFAGLLH